MGGETRPEWYTKENADGRDPEMLAKILGLGLNDEVSWYAIINPHCPPEALARLLDRGAHGRMSQCAAENPRCPPYARLKWSHKARGLFPPADRPPTPPEEIDVMDVAP